ncbi:MAG: sigma factor-like helix-turn-helix DNA-binding protein [Bacteroidota bacterium]
MMRLLFWKRNYRKLYGQNIDRLRKFFFYGCGDFDQSEEMAENVMWHLRHYGRIFSYQGAQKYLYIEARMVAAQLQLDQYNTHFDTSPKPLPLGVEDENSTYPAEEYLEAAFSHLSLRVRQVFLFHRLDKLSMEEIASTVGIPVDQVEIALAEAKHRLQQSIPKAS